MAKSTGSEGTRDGGRNNPAGGGSRSNPKSDKDVAAGRKGDANAGGRATSHAHKSSGAPQGNDVTATKKKADELGVSPDRYMGAVNAYAGRVRDYFDADNSITENIGNALAGMLGFDEQMPDFNVNNMSVNTRWGFDPIQAAANVGGLMSGLPVGTIYKGVKTLTGLNPSIDVGTSVIGDDDPLDQGGDVSNSSGGGMLSGGKVGPAGGGYGGNGNGGGGLMTGPRPPRPGVPTLPGAAPQGPARPAPPPAVMPPRKVYNGPANDFQTPSQKWGQTGFYDVDPATGEVTWRQVG